MPDTDYFAANTDTGATGSARLDAAGQFRWLAAVSMLFTAMLALLLLTVTHIGSSFSAHTVCGFKPPLSQDQPSPSAKRLEPPDAREHSK